MSRCRPRAARRRAATTRHRRAASGPTEFEVCGADRLRNATERELRRLGRRVYRRPAAAEAGLGALSARQLEIALLVTARKTNREIAAELFLSKKTVETHLRNIFRKLDVTSRRAVANALESAQHQATGAGSTSTRG